MGNTLVKMADVEKENEGGKIERRLSEESRLSDQEHIDVFTPAEQRQIIRRIDFRLVTTLGFMYCVSLMDRTVSSSISSTRIRNGAANTVHRTWVLWRFQAWDTASARRDQRFVVNMLTRNLDLVLIGYRYSIITLVFFITYVILQPFATVVLRKVGPRIFLPSITILWGITMMCFGFLTSWTQMVRKSESVSLLWLGVPRRWCMRHN